MQRLHLNKPPCQQIPGAYVCFSNWFGQRAVHPRLTSTNLQLGGLLASHSVPGFGCLYGFFVGPFRSLTSVCGLLGHNPPIYCFMVRN